MLNKLKDILIDKIKTPEPENLNRSKLINSYIQGSLISDGFPIMLIIEPTNYCNLDCIMCPRNYMKRKVGMMSIDLFKKIIDESKGYVEFIYLHLFGESLFNKNIFKMIKFATEADIKVGLATNATLLSEVNACALLNSGLNLLILSLDNPDKDTYNKVRVGGNFEQVEKNVVFFLKELQKSKYKPKVILQMVALDSTRKEQNHFIDKFSGLSDVYIKIKEFSNWAGQIDSINQLVKTEARPITKSKCFEPWRGLTIYWDGTVVPCCNDFDGCYILGNINHSAIKDIWNGETMQRLRKSFQVAQGRVNLCKSCPTRNLTYKECYTKPSPFFPYEHEVNFFCK